MPLPFGFLTFTLASLISTTAFSFGKSAGEVFSANKNAILSKKVSVIGEWAFSHSSIKVLRDNSTSRNLAVSKASYAAKISFLDSLINKQIDLKNLDMPDTLQPKFIKAVRYYVLENAFDLTGIQQVHSEVNKEKVAHVVLALPQKKYSLPKDLSKDSITEKIIKDALTPDYSYDVFLVLELLNGKHDVDEILTYFIDFIMEKYKVEDFPLIVNGEKIKAIPDGFLVEHLMDEIKFKNLFGLPNLITWSISFVIQNSFT